PVIQADVLVRDHAGRRALCPKDELGLRSARNESNAFAFGIDARRDLAELRLEPPPTHHHESPLFGKKGRGANELRKTAMRRETALIEEDACRALEARSVVETPVVFGSLERGEASVHDDHGIGELRITLGEEISDALVDRDEMIDVRSVAALLDPIELALESRQPGRLLEDLMAIIDEHAGRPALVFHARGKG